MHDDLDDPPIERPEITRPAYAEPRHPPPRSGIAVAVVLALLAAGVGWYMIRREPAPVAPAAREGSAPEAADSAPSPADDAEPPLELPALDASDALVRELVSRVSAHPQLVSWLVNDDLIRRAVAAVENLADGASPTNALRFLTPPERFEVQDSGDRLLVDPASYARYDLLTEVFVSLDTAGTARLYRQFRPLLEQAHREVGSPERTVEESLALAIGALLAAPVSDEPLEVVPRETGWVLADPRLEELSAAEKHLLRLGPNNARRVQAKLRELAAALSIRPRQPE